MRLNGSVVSLMFRKYQPERSVNVLKSLSNPVRVKLLYGMAQNRSAIEAAETKENPGRSLGFEALEY